MKRSRLWHVWAVVWALALLGLIAAAMVGCAGQAAQATPSVVAYGGALDTSYEGALDAAGQLALGTLRLEDTPDAVGETQAAQLLPLWQALTSGAAQGDAEQRAVTRQIEAAMSEAQLAAIAGMRLADADVQAWLQSRGEPGALPGQQGGAPLGQQGGAGRGLSEDQIAQMREQFGAQGGASAEERATRRAQFSEGGGFPGAGSTAAGASATSATLARAVVVLLMERSGQAAARQAMPPAAGGQPTPTPQAAITRTPLPVQSATPHPSATATPAPTPSITATATAQPVATAQPQATPTPQAAQPTPTLAAAATTAPALARVEDTSPGPPFTISVSVNQATQDPVVDKSETYQITGVVRNDGDQTYAVSAIHVTFYDASGFRGTFTPAVREGRVVGGEWDWHGEIDAEFAALLLAPGEAWPYQISIVAQDMASFLIHPDAAPTDRASAAVALSGVQAVEEGTGYVRISGVATNENAFEVKNVTVSGVLLDAGGGIVSLGSTYVLQEDIAPGASVRFALRVHAAPHVGYQLYAQAERDWS
ncbi:MAG: hypothetical protein JXA09_06050 [Anaerolineae bacterium]|nr:hypothetical protein [Anaerolineae bacterium]